MGAITLYSLFPNPFMAQNQCLCGCTLCTLSFSVSMTGCRVAVLHREKFGVALRVTGVTLDRISHCPTLHHWGNRVYRNLIEFRRLLLRQATTLGDFDEDREHEELLNELHLRTGNSLSYFRCGSSTCRFAQRFLRSEASPAASYRSFNVLNLRIGKFCEPNADKI